MSILTILLWLVPFLILPLAYVTARRIPFRKERFFTYFILLLILLFKGLFKLSFTIAAADTLLSMLVLFMVAELFWAFNRFKSKKVFVILIVLFLIPYSAYLFNWITNGPVYNVQYWKTMELGRKANGTGVYFVKDMRNAARLNHTIGLYKRTAVPVLYKQIDEFITGKGYFKTSFACRWSETKHGVKADICDGPTVVWSIGEGINLYK